MASDRDTLPKSVRPSHYAISLTNLTLGPPWSYQGSVRIDVDVKESTKEVVLNAHQLEIEEAHAYATKSDPIKASRIDYDEKAQRATLSFPQALPTTSEAQLLLKFKGTMNNQMAGFYRSKYKPTVTPAKSVPHDDEYHYMFSTQFESCSARMAFPCFDEPNLKASFDVELEIPEDQVALSNMPEKETKKGSKDGLKMVSFDRSPVMSTYLLAWAFGDFEYVEDHTRRKYKGKNLPVRVYSTRGLKEQGRYALEHAHKVIDLFSDVFRIEYPLPKSDLLAVHEFSHGAMENWGLVTYRTTAVLYDEKTSDQRFKNRIAYVVAHELAHQWFGNLVTMDWWSELWLNEGFATWVGWFAVDHLHPEWNVMAQFVTEGMQMAFDLDSLRSSHPIEVPVRDALEVEQVFDHISYLKGSSIIRMLSAHVTQEKFLLGVSNYLKAHAYGNATTNDLWKALSEASGKDVKTFIDPWIRKIGFPVLTVAEEPGQISVRQSRFLSTGDVKSEDDETIWWLPLGLQTASEASADTTKALTVKEDTIRQVDEKFYKLNKDQTGFYRTNYPPARLAKLGEAKDQLSIQDKIGLIGDASALAISGDATTTGLLSFIENFQGEDNFLVWSQITSSLGTVRSVFSDNEKISKGLKNFTLKLVTSATDKLGWDFPPNEDYLTSQLRALLIGTAGMAGHESIISESKRRYTLYTEENDTSAIHPSLRGPVWRIAIAEGGQKEYDAMKHLFQTTSSIDGKEIALQAMGRVPSPRLAIDYFTFLMSEAVPIQDVHSGANSLAVNPKARLILWQMIEIRWDHVKKRIGGNSVVMDRFLRMSLSNFADKGVGEDIEYFFGSKDNSGYDRGLGVVKDTIQGNARYKERDTAVVEEWLGARGYL
ncbi:MAG: hypothetical protein M1828_007497 [Chrysothrix sp. TS-e1954]|nr:MAG: hypothetical protein M1828_007497 [Chrysothrix sp. TS-e1954]